MLFSSIPGHAFLKERLIEMANARRVGHALLFWGDEGMGALPLALALAQQMVCPTAKEGGVACGKCPPCNKMQKLIHPDLHFAVPVNSVKPSDRNPVTDHYAAVWKEALLENPYMSEYQWYDKLGIDNKSGNMSVHEADAIVKKLSFKPFEGDCKFMIIWLPECMNIQAANTLLKILEEPSVGTHFFLVSEHPEQLLPTIRSRCQLIRVNPISKEEQALRPAIRSEQEEEIEQYARDFITHSVNKNLFLAIQWAEDVAGFGRERQRQLVLCLLQILRNTYMEHLHADRITTASPDQIPHLRSWANKLSTTFFSIATDALNGALSDIDRNVNSKMTFYTVALRFNFAT